jgi:hypothetical protein
MFVNMVPTNKIIFLLTGAERPGNLKTITFTSLH